jgi:hypothetical protein
MDISAHCQIRIDARYACDPAPVGLDLAQLSPWLMK